MRLKKSHLLPTVARHILWKVYVQASQLANMPSFGFSPQQLEFRGIAPAHVGVFCARVMIWNWALRIW